MRLRGSERTACRERPPAWWSQILKDTPIQRPTAGLNGLAHAGRLQWWVGLGACARFAETPHKNCL